MQFEAIIKCRSTPAIIEEFDEELFCMIIEKIIMMPERNLIFRLKNGLELPESYGREA